MNNKNEINNNRNNGNNENKYKDSIFYNILDEYCKYNVDPKKNDTRNIILWHIIFIILIPIIIYTRYGILSFRYYLPIVDLIAAGTVYIGEKHRKLEKIDNNDSVIYYFNGLYKLIPTNIVSYISSNIINLLALSGVALHSILWSINRGGIFKGLGVAVIMFFVTFLLPSILLPKILDKIIENIDKYILNSMFLDHETKNKKKVFEEVIVSFIIIVLLILIESFIIHFLIED